MHRFHSAALRPRFGFLWIRVLLAALASLSVAASGGPQVAPVAALAAGEPGAYTIVISDTGFSPRQLTVAPGSTITWVNHGTQDHEVTFNRSGGFGSPALPPGGSWSLTFPDSLVAHYYDSLHPGVMTGIAHVTY